MDTNRVARVVLVALEVLMGLAAVVSGPALVVTNGLGMPEEWMQNSLFGTYTVPGLVLLAVGIANLGAAFTVLRRHRYGAVVSEVVGIMWIVWFAVQVSIVGLVSWQQPLYFGVGLLITMLALPSLVGQARMGDTW